MSPRERSSIVRIDDLAYAAALRLQSLSPRADYTIAQLPPITLPLVATDLILVYRNGVTYNVSALTTSAGGAGAQSGIVSSVVTDGSVTYTVTFGLTYVTQVKNIRVQIVGGVTWGGYAVRENVFNLALTGFQFTVTGGLSPTTPAPVTVYWEVTGV